MTRARPIATDLRRLQPSHLVALSPSVAGLQTNPLTDTSTETRTRTSTVAG